MGYFRRYCLLFAYCASFFWRPSLCQISCTIANCICLRPVGTFCTLAVQDLSGYTTRLPTILPGSFSQASFVLSLNLARNEPLTLQEGSFEGLTNVTTLDLSSNQLAHLPSGVFSPMAQLTSLDLSGNSLTELNPDAFNGLLHLQTLNVQNNLFDILSEDLLSRLPSLNTLYLSQNSYNCSNPKIVELYTLLVTSSVNVVDDSLVRCRNGTRVLDLNIDVIFSSSTTVEATSSTEMRVSPTATVDSTDVVLASTSATDVVLASTSATDVVLVSTSATDVVLASTSATDVVLASTSATDVVLASTSATDVVLVSTSAMDIVLASTSATDLVLASTSATDVVLVSTSAMDIVLASTSATDLVLVSTSATDVVLVSTSAIIEATPSPQPTATIATTTTVTEGMQSCPADITLTYSGYLSWPITGLGKVTTATCPNGGGVARRLCMTLGVWSEVIEEQDCEQAPVVQRMLADLTASTVTQANSEAISEQLVNLPTDTAFSLQEIDTITSLAAELVGVGSTSVNVLNNTLQALDNVLNSSGSVLSQDQDGQLATRIREVIDSLLLDALNINQSVLILSFTHLAVGGVYLPATSSTHLIASIRVLTNGNVVISVGGSDGDIVVDATGNSTVQVTVYEGDGLFQAADCGNLSTAASTNETVKGTVLTPIISVVNKNGSEADNEVVTITYSRAPYRLITMGGERYVCARWNTSVNCGGGGWTTKDCSLHVTEDGAYRCRCLHQGVYTLLDIPPEDTHPLDISNLPIIARIIFYILSASTIPFYLTIVITIIVHKELRVVPALQSLANQSLSQGLTLLILVISYERDEVLGVCYALGVVLQYLYLVSLSWMAVHPVVICIEIFKRLLYEKTWLIWPFVVACWSWPMVTVVYGGLRYDALTDNTTTFNCWLESALFPSTITYITAVAALAVLLAIGTCVIFLRCSDYDIEVSTYFRLLSLYPNALVFIGMILTQYFTAASTQFEVNPYYLLLGTSGCAVFCGSYFFISNGLFQNTVRNAIFCKGDPMSKNKIDKYATNYIKQSHFYEDDESTDSGLSLSNPRLAQMPRPPKPRGRVGKRGSTGQGMSYMNDYLSGQCNYGRKTANPVPLSLFGQMQLNGRVRGGGRLIGDLGPNPAYNIDLTTSTDA